MLEHLRVFLLIVEIDRFKTIRTWYWVIDKLIFPVTVWFTHWNLVHHTWDLLLGIPDPIEPYIEDNPSLRKFIPFLTYLKQFVIFIQLVSWKEWLEDDTSFGIAAEGWREMGGRNVINLFDNYGWGTQRQLQFEFYKFPFMRSRLYFGIFSEESFLFRHNGLNQLLFTNLKCHGAITIKPHTGKKLNSNMRIMSLFTCNSYY